MTPRYILVPDGGFRPSVRPVANPRHRYYYSSIILSVDYKPLQLHSTDMHKDRCSQRKSYSPTVFRPRNPPKRISRFDLPNTTTRLPPGSIKPQLDPQ